MRRSCPRRRARVARSSGTSRPPTPGVSKVHRDRSRYSPSTPDPTALDQRGSASTRASRDLTTRARSLRALADRVDEGGPGVEVVEQDLVVGLAGARPARGAALAEPHPVVRAVTREPIARLGSAPALSADAGCAPRPTTAARVIAATMTPRPRRCCRLMRAGSPMRAWTDHGPAVWQALVRWGQGGSRTVPIGSRTRRDGDTRSSARPVDRERPTRRDASSRSGTQGTVVHLPTAVRPKGTGGGPLAQPTSTRQAEALPEAHPGATAYPRGRPRQAAQEVP